MRYFYRLGDSDSCRFLWFLAWTGGEADTCYQVSWQNWALILEKFQHGHQDRAMWGFHWWRFGRELLGPVSQQDEGGVTRPAGEQLLTYPRFPVFCVGRCADATCIACVSEISTLSIFKLKGLPSVQDHVTCSILFKRENQWNIIKTDFWRTVTLWVVEGPPKCRAQS